MTALRALPASDDPKHSITNEMRCLINQLRFYAAECRASAHLDIYAACALIDPHSGDEVAARTLLRVLGQVLDRPPLWYRPGEPSYSFDELWLAQVLTSWRLNDVDSLAFLTMSRIPKAKRRLFHMLVANLNTAPT